MRRRETLTLTPEQLERVEMREASIGAFARRRRRRRIGVGLVGLGLIGAAGWLYLRLRPEGVGLAAGYPASLRCGNCGYNEVRSTAYSQSFPALCPKCKSRALAPLWKCHVCAAEFLPGPERPVRCISCGSDQVGSPLAP